LAISTLLTGVFLFCGTTARTSNALLGWNCAYTFTSDVMYGVLYAITPELFPTKDRGTGNGVAATANRIFGTLSPIVALYADLNTPVPIYSASLLCSFVLFRLSQHNYSFWSIILSSRSNCPPSSFRHERESQFVGASSCSGCRAVGLSGDRSISTLV